MEESLGPYRLVAELGSGGTSTVYLARVETSVHGLPPGTRVAVKVIHPHLFQRPDFLARFVREVEIGSAVHHENVVRVLDVGVGEREGSQVHFLVMEYVEGQTLSSLLEELGPLSEELCLHIAKEIARALAAIHAAGIVHRDLKPENVLIAGGETIKLMDLGVARLKDEQRRLSVAGQFVGSLLYAAPEQFHGGGADVDERTDLYSLGVVLYELATGVHPFQKEDMSALVRRQLGGSPARPNQVNSTISSFFDELILALMEKRPEDRIASAECLLEILELKERSPWWIGRRPGAAPARPLRHMRIPRATAVYGRERELDELERAYRDVQRGEGRVFLVRGEAGIGKSRLVDELVSRLTERGPPPHFLFGAYPPGGAATAAGAFSTAYREHFGSENVEAALASHMGPTQSLIPSFAALLRGEPPPEGRPLDRESIQTLFLHATRGLAREHPVIVLVDDLHFAPEEGRALFAAVAHGVAGARVLLLGTMRARVPESWTASLLRLPHVQSLHVGRLLESDVRGILEEVLGSPATAAALAPELERRSDGNPFFLFEMIRSLRDEGALVRESGSSWSPAAALRRIQVPASMEGLVRERIARLTDGERELLDVAACAGYRFDPGLVAVAVEAGRVPVLKAFVRLEREHQIVRAEGRKYSFDHHQIQEVLYGEIPEMLREEYHGALADAIREAEGGSADTIAGEVAVDLTEHLLRAGRHAEALGSLDEAVAHLEGGYLKAPAADLISRMLNVPEVVCSRDRARLTLRYAELLEGLGRREEQRASLQESIRFSDEVGDDVLAGKSRQRLADYFRAMGQAERSLELLGKAWILATSAADAREQGRVLGLTGSALADLGRLAEAKDRYEEALAIARESDDGPGEARALGNLAVLAWQEGLHDDAIPLYEQALELFRQAEDRRSEAVATGNLGLVHRALGRRDLAQPLFEDQLRISREIGDRRIEAMALGSLSGLAGDEGRYGEALEYSRMDVQITAELGEALQEATALSARSMILLELGRVEEVASILALAREHLKTGRSPLVEAYVHFATGWSMEENDDSEAGAEYRHALEQFSATEAKSSVGEVLVVLGRWHARRGEREAARSAFREACKLGRETLSHIAIPAVTGLASVDPSRVAAARRELSAREEEMTARDRMLAWLDLWRGSGETADLRRARALLDRLQEGVPPELVESFRTRVRTHRELLAACGESEGSANASKR